jgi:hypothetical protein
MTTAGGISRLKTADGEDLIPTRVQFDVANAAALSRALDGRAELARAGEGWLWSGKNQRGAQITLGYLTQRGDRLRSRAAAPVFSSDEVYFLPGTIDITKVRKLQELERAPDGRAILRRHLVRGHWRRPVQTWVDLRLRWIAPYWKGPDMAGITEHAYRLKP